MALWSVAEYGATVRVTVPQQQDRARPRGFDAFCGAGGATRGYQNAGAYMVGCDIRPQPRYVGEEFVQGDALEFLADVDFMAQFDFIHASPPCQGYTTMVNRFPERRDSYPMLIDPTRELLKATGLPYVIENVMGARAHLESPARICGVSLNLGVQRHRLFETNFPLLVPPCACGDHKLIVGVYGARPDGRRLNSRAVKRIQYAAASLEEGQEAMGIDWMEWSELREAIPPRYTEIIGAALLSHLKAQAVA